MKKRSLLILVLLAVASIVGFRGDAQVSHNDPPGHGGDIPGHQVRERMCPVHFSDDQVRVIENDFAKRNGRKPGGGGGGGGGTPPHTVTGGVIPVYFHVVKHSDGRGALTTDQINEQIEVLNGAFSKWGWNFSLAHTTVTTNDAYFNAGHG